MSHRLKDLEKRIKELEKALTQRIPNAEHDPAITFVERIADIRKRLEGAKVDVAEKSAAERLALGRRDLKEWFRKHGGDQSTSDKAPLSDMVLLWRKDLPGVDYA
jgi:uncharacterized coiled-coil DUF342 family protein